MTGGGHGDKKRKRGEDVSTSVEFVEPAIAAALKMKPARKKNKTVHDSSLNTSVSAVDDVTASANVSVPALTSATASSSAPTRLVYDRSPRGDSNDMKHTLLYHVYTNKYHIKGSKASNFAAVAKEFELTRTQGLTKVSAESLQRKYQDIMQDIKNSIDNGLLRYPDDDVDDSFIPSDDEDEGLDDVDTSDTEIQAQRESRREYRAKKRLDSALPFERTALMILKEVQEAADLKQLAQVEKIEKDNKLSATEETILGSIETTDNNTSSSSSGNSVKNKPRTNRHDSDMDEFRSIMKSALSPPPAVAVAPAVAVTPAAAIVPAQEDPEELTNRIVDELNSRDITTVLGLLRAAYVSQAGINNLLESTGLGGDRPARKLVVLYLSMQSLKELQSTCDLKAGDAVELKDFMATVSHK